MNDDDFSEAALGVYDELLQRTGEGAPEHRLDATRRLVDVLGDPQRAYPIIHLTGTNGKTSTSRMIESLVRAHGLRTGLLTSPHLISFNERIVLDGQPISDEALVRNWNDVAPYVEMVDAELEAKGKAHLTFFEVLTGLAFAVFADAPVDVAIIEVGMGGEWDSTNVGDGDVAVITPISLDHTTQLGSTIQAIARTKSGIIKPLSDVVTARQDPEALSVLVDAAAANEASLRCEGVDFDVMSSTLAVGGQLVTVRGLAHTYPEVFIPLYGEHQAQNAALALAAVETFLGQGAHPLSPEVVDEAFTTVTSPGRLQLIGVEPTVLVDAAHNPAGAQSLVNAIRASFTFSEVAVVLGTLNDKDAAGVIAPLASLANVFFVTEPESSRARNADELADLVRAQVGEEKVIVYPSPRDAVDSARSWAMESAGRAVIVTGSIVLIGAIMEYAQENAWKATNS